MFMINTVSRYWLLTSSGRYSLSDAAFYVTEYEPSTSMNPTVAEKFKLKKNVSMSF